MSTIDATGGIVRSDSDAGADEHGASATRSPRRLRWRKRLVTTLAVLTCFGMLSSVIAIWTHRTLLNTDAWMEVVGPLGEDPAVTNAVAIALTDQVYQLVQPEQRLQEALPPKAAFLAAPLSTAVRKYVEDAAATVLQSDQFKTFWNTANRAAHEAAVKLLRGEPVGGFAATNGVVTFNFFPLITRTLQFIDSKAHGLFGDRTIPDITADTPPDVARQELSAGLGIPIPATFGVVTVFESDQLAQAQQLVQLFDKLVYLIVGGTLLLLVATIALSLNRRRTLLVLGLGTALAMVLANAAINAFQKQVVGLIAGDAARAAAGSTIENLVQSLSVFTDVLIWGGLLLVTVTFLTGETRAARSIRRATAAGLGRVGSRSDDDDIDGETGIATAGLGASKRLATSSIPFVHAHQSALRVAGVLVAMVWLIAINVTWASLAVVAAALVIYEIVITVLGGGSSPDTTTEELAA